MATIDFGRRSEDYAVHRHGPPEAFFDRLETFVPLEGTEVLDVGAGPGTVSIPLARRGARVTALDVAEEQLAAGRARVEHLGLSDRGRFERGTAEETGLDADSFALVTAGQCWHWFDSPAAFAEARRVLRPGGTVAVVAYSYLAEHSPIAADSEALILEFNPGWTMAGWTGLFPEWIDEAVRTGLELVEQFCWDYDEPYSQADWRGRVRTCNGVGSGGLPPERVPEFDEALSALLARKYPDPMAVRHRLWCVVARKPE